MRTILVSGASGIVGYGILKSLRQSHPECRLIGTSIYERSAAQAFCDIFEKAPLTNYGGYIAWLADLIKKHNVALAIPGIEADVVTWSEHRTKIEQTGAAVLLNNPELIRLCSDKWLFYQRLVENNSPYAIPTCLGPIEGQQSLPLFLKPRKGSASKGVAVIKTAEDLSRRLKDIGSDMMVQPVVGTVEEEFTTSAFFDRHSKLCAFNTLKRKLSQAGFTEIAETVDVSGMAEALSHLGEIFMPVGPTNFQFRLDKGQLKLLEINPRISSATSLRTAFGYNESAMSVEVFLQDRIPSQPPVKRGFAVRYTEDLIFYDSPDF